MWSIILLGALATAPAALGKVAAGPAPERVRAVELPVPRGAAPLQPLRDLRSLPAPRVQPAPGSDPGDYPMSDPALRRC